MTQKDKTWLFIATGFYSGKAPVAPGTFGTLAALPLAWVVSLLPWPVAVAAIAGVAVLSVISADKAQEILGKKDPGQVVMDEMAGLLVTMAFVPFTWKTALLGFALFRFFDILKPPPVNYFDQKVPGGLGVTADDLMAGVYAQIVLRIVLAVF